jgi:hypothetical protein
MCNVRTTGTEKRHTDIYEKFKLLLKERYLKYPEDAPSMSNKKLYEQIADEYGYSTEFVSKVIRKKLRQPSN